MADINSQQYRRTPASFNRPANTTTYAAGQPGANNPVAGPLVPLSWKTAGNRAFWIPVFKLYKSGIGLAGASFRLHLLSALPTFSGGDGSAVSSVIGNAQANWIADFDFNLVTAFSDGCAGKGVPTEGVINLDFQGDPTTLYGVLEAVGAYAPTNAEIFTLWMQQEFPR